MKISLKKRLVLGVLPDRLLQVRGPADGHACYLSFDDGPHPEHTPRLLERTVSEQYALGSHLYNHRGFVALPFAKQITEIHCIEELLSAFDQRSLRRLLPAWREQGRVFRALRTDAG